MAGIASDGVCTRAVWVVFLAQDVAWTCIHVELHNFSAFASDSVQVALCWQPSAFKQLRFDTLKNMVAILCEESCYWSRFIIGKDSLYDMSVSCMCTTPYMVFSTFLGPNAVDLVNAVQSQLAAVLSTAGFLRTVCLVQSIQPHGKQMCNNLCMDWELVQGPNSRRTSVCITTSVWKHMPIMSCSGAELYSD